MNICAEKEWVEKEFAEINFGDSRLNKTLLLIATRLASRNEAATYEGCDSWNDAKGTCRTFE